MSECYYIKYKSEERAKVIIDKLTAVGYKYILMFGSVPINRESLCVDVENKRVCYPGIAYAPGRIIGFYDGNDFDYSIFGIEVDVDELYKIN